MIKLLVVDDEILTREGIIDGIPWKEIGVDRIEQADDGSTGFELAKVFRPDIVLSDVRMPCMDGIDMSRRIRRLYPECKIIFMSGYSDKEYLMSAIELKAVSYIEKPIKRDELKRALEEAVRSCRNAEAQKQSEMLNYKKLSMSMPYLKNKMAIRLLDSNLNQDSLKELLDMEVLEVDPDADFITAVIKIINTADMDGRDFSVFSEQLVDSFERLLKECGLKGIMAFRDNQHLIAHICCEGRTDEDFLEQDMTWLSNRLTELLGHNKFFIGLGCRVSGVIGLSKSYTQAIISLQKVFFRGYGALVSGTDDASPAYSFDELLLEKFSDFLTRGRQYDAEILLHNLANEIRKKENTLVNYVKDIFHRFMLALIKRVEEPDVAIYMRKVDRNYLWEKFSKFHTLDEVKNYLISEVSKYFDALKRIQNESDITMRIIDYIKNNYMRESLSVKDISANTFLSTAYMCTYFKQKTGKTINQFITEYRLDKAKELLQKKELSVAEVASQVGYSDNNYFTKLFKRSMNITPSEFRDRIRT